MKIYLLFVIVLLFATCCKDQNPNVPGCQKEKSLPDEYHEYWLGEAKDYMYFKKGTWWVYRNVQNGKTDSVYVTSNRLDTSTIRGRETYSSHRIYTIETCRIVTKSNTYNKFYDWNNGSPNPDGTTVPRPLTTIWERNKSTPGGNIQPCFHTPFVLNMRTDANLINIDTTLILNNKTYQSVKIFKLPFDDTYMDILFDNPTYTMNYTLLYYAPNFGIIKSEIPDRNVSMEMIKSNILQ